MVTHLLRFAEEPGILRIDFCSATELIDTPSSVGRFPKNEGAARSLGSPLAHRSLKQLDRVEEKPSDAT